MVFLAALLVFCMAGLLEGAILMWMQCTGDNSVGDLMLRSTLHLFGADPPHETSHQGCVAVYVMAQATGLVLQAVLVAVITVRLLHPRYDLIFSPHLLATRRDGAPLLMFRVAHPLGHQMSNMSIHVAHVRPKRSMEGEAFAEIT